MKKVNFTKTPVEYELAPYEMLMSDIQKGPRLNKIMVDGELPPRLKKDAHDIILQFIKARPPLKPVRKQIIIACSSKIVFWYEIHLWELRLCSIYFNFNFLARDLAKALNMLFLIPYPKFSTFSTF